MERFWRHGFYATSIEDLVAATGLTRAALYAEIGDKAGLFRASLALYSQEVVAPLLAPMESSPAGLADLKKYFETQIARAERAGLPGPGCFMANTMIECSVVECSMAECGPHEESFSAVVSQHLKRMTEAFRLALQYESLQRTGRRLVEVERLAWNLTISAQGLWSVSRVVSDAKVLRAYAEDLFRQVERRLVR